MQVLQEPFVNRQLAFVNHYLVITTPRSATTPLLRGIFGAKDYYIKQMC
jgi:hypothetical protein